MKKYRFFEIVFVLLVSVGLLYAEFPFEQSWRWHSNYNCELLGDYWQEDGQTYFLVAVSNGDDEQRIEIISEGESVWQSGWLSQTITVAKQFDFQDGEGAKIVAGAYDDRYGYVQVFSRDEFSEHSEFCSFSMGEIINVDYDYWDYREVVFMEGTGSIFPDVNEVIRIGVHHISEWNRDGGGIVSDYFADGGMLFHYSALNGEYTQIDSFYSRISSSDNFRDNDNEQFLVIGGRYCHYYYSWSEYGEIERQATKHDLIIFDQGTDIVGSYTLLYTNSCYDGTPSNIPMISILEREQNQHFCYAVHWDTCGYVLSEFSLPDLERERYRRINPFDTLIEYVNLQNNREHSYLFGIADSGEVTIIDVDDFVIADIVDFKIEHIGSEIANFDDDEALELAYLTNNALVIYDIAELGVLGDNSVIPEGYSLNAAYPNPFNSRLSIGFSMPESGVYAISVYDITGVEVARLSQGLVPAGSHRVTWNAGYLPSGMYLIKLNADNRTFTRKVQLVK